MLLKWLSRLKFDLYVAGSAIIKVAISSHKAEIDKMLAVWLLYFQSGQFVFNENCVLSTLSRHCLLNLMSMALIIIILLGWLMVIPQKLFHIR